MAGAEARRRGAAQQRARTRARRAQPNVERTERDQQGATARSAERSEGRPRVEGNLKLSGEHATRVSETLRRTGHRENVNINVRVGVRVPETVRFQPLPEDVVAIVPEYRGYDYFIDVSDEIVFVSPQTHEVVGMIDYEAPQHGRASDSSRVIVARELDCPDRTVTA